MKRINFISLFSILFPLIGCAPLGPSVIKTYNDNVERSQIAIFRVDKSKGLRIVGCDNQFLKRGAKYILLKPGPHEILYSVYGPTIFKYYSLMNKKYLNVIGGHTYILKPKGGDMFFVGDKRFPEIFDVTDDSALHVEIIPLEENIN